jgi:hypothetical protein
MIASEGTHADYGHVDRKVVAQKITPERSATALLSHETPTSILRRRFHGEKVAIGTALVFLSDAITA